MVMHRLHKFNWRYVWMRAQAAVGALGHGVGAGTLQCECVYPGISGKGRFFSISTWTSPSSTECSTGPWRTRPRPTSTCPTAGFTRWVIGDGGSGKRYRSLSLRCELRTSSQLAWFFRSMFKWLSQFSVGLIMIHFMFESHYCYILRYCAEWIFRIHHRNVSYIPGFTWLSLALVLLCENTTELLDPSNQSGRDSRSQKSPHISAFSQH